MKYGCQMTSFNLSTFLLDFQFKALYGGLKRSERFQFDRCYLFGASPGKLEKVYHVIPPKPGVRHPWLAGRCYTCYTLHLLRKPVRCFHKTHSSLRLFWGLGATSLLLAPPVHMFSYILQNGKMPRCQNQWWSVAVAFLIVALLVTVLRKWIHRL